jgi:hypothetical protein
MEIVSQLARYIDWNAIQSLGTLIAALIAWLVFLEARAIKKLQWESQAADKWQDFNRLLIETSLSDRWEAIRSGGPVDKLGATDKRLMLMYFNIQMIEYHLIKEGIVPSSALPTMQSELAAFRTHREYVDGVLADGGYDPDYVRFVSECMQVVTPERRLSKQ